MFIYCVEMKIMQLRSKDKCDKQIRYYFYSTWAVKLKNSGLGFKGSDNCPHYTFPKCVLDYLRSILPKDIKGEIRNTAYKVSLAEFCDKVL